LILVDTSAWIEFLRATGHAADLRLRGLIDRDELATTEPVVMELLAGAADESQAVRLRRLVLRAELLPVDGLSDFEKAAALTPTNYLLWANLGDAYRWAPGQRAKSDGAYERALRLIRDAIAINAKDAQARAIAASCLAKRGDLAAAQEWMAHRNASVA